LVEKENPRTLDLRCNENVVIKMKSQGKEGERVKMNDLKQRIERFAKNKMQQIALLKTYLPLREQQRNFIKFLLDQIRENKKLSENPDLTEFRTKNSFLVSKGSWFSLLARF